MNSIFEEVIGAGMEAGAKALKPCPFCGGRYLGLHQEISADGGYMMYVECHNCGARGRLSIFPYPQVADIKSTWNDRAERQGRWICENCGDFVCSVCGWAFSSELPYMARNRDAKTEDIMRYCLHCGAELELKRGDEDAEQQTETDNNSETG